MTHEVNQSAIFKHGRELNTSSVLSGTRAVRTDRLTMLYLYKNN